MRARYLVYVMALCVSYLLVNILVNSYIMARSRAWPTKFIYSGWDTLLIHWMHRSFHWHHMFGVVVREHWAMPLPLISLTVVSCFCVPGSPGRCNSVQCADVTGTRLSRWEWSTKLLDRTKPQSAPTCVRYSVHWGKDDPFVRPTVQSTHSLLACVHTKHLHTCVPYTWRA